MSGRLRRHDDSGAIVIADWWQRFSVPLHGLAAPRNAEQDMAGRMPCQMLRSRSQDDFPKSAPVVVSKHGELNLVLFHLIKQG